MTDLKLGLVGCGTIARTQHLPAISATAGIELVALADPIATHERLPVYPDLATMLALHPEVDAVVLCQPPAFRYGAACEAIEAGRHVMLEKPPAATMVEAADLIDRARRHKVALYATWHSRQGAAVEQAKAWLREAVPSAVHITWKEDVRQWHPGQSWIWSAGGFGVFDPGINALSILTAILPGQVTLQSSELEVPQNCAMPIAAKLRMRNAEGYPINAEFDWRQTGPQIWDITCETDRGLLVLSDGGNRLMIDGVDQDVRPDDEYGELYRRFADLSACSGLDVDLEPLRLVEEALAKGTTCCTNPFEDSCQGWLDACDPERNGFGAGGQAERSSSW